MNKFKFRASDRWHLPDIAEWGCLGTFKLEIDEVENQIGPIESKMFYVISNQIEGNTVINE